MRDLPTGTVTLLFTDIEGSTRLLQQVGEDYSHLLAECRHVLRASFHQWHGHGVETQGDSFLVTFARATDALEAAVEAQHALARHAWPHGVTVRVRMGLHTGEPQLSAEGYVGLDVHRAARIMSAGRGGQVLLSQTTRDLVEHDLPEGVSLRDLGAHRLKDLQHLSHLFQLVMSGLPADFPSLKTLDLSRNNLPSQPSAFIGREQEAARVQHLLQREDVRFLTLTGPGGSGKTRLGLQVAAELSDGFADGVYFVNLAPLSDPEFVVPTIAQALALKETGGQPFLDLLKACLREKQLLLLLDNFEQVVSAAVQVAELLNSCPKLKVLVTSRMVLHLRGEQEFTVSPLAVPDPHHLPDLVILSQYEAVALFILRVQSLKPDFQINNANAPTIAEICARLDGLPLAIELAAARSKVLPPQALLARLGQRLTLLTGGARDAPARQQTLRDTIKWSYDLLETEEQRLFRWLSVFAGGCTLEAIETVGYETGHEEIDVLNSLASLIDKSLVQQSEQEAGEPRFSMLETVREYGLERLSESRESGVSQQAHALYYLALAEEAEPHLKGAQQVLWWRRLEQEQENLRAALVWLIKQEQGELALRLSGALWRFWRIRGYSSEGWRWLEAALRLPQARGRTAWRAKALYGASEFGKLLAHPATRSLLEESVVIYRELGDKRGLAESLADLGWVLSTQNDVVAARTLQEESVALAREVGDRWILAAALRDLGAFMRYHGDIKSARLFLEESVMLYRVLKDHHALSHTLLHLVQAVMLEGNLTQATALTQESLVLAQELDNGPTIARALHRLAVIKSLQGDAEQAVALLEESLALARDLGDKGQIAYPKLTLGGIVLCQGNLLQAEACAQESLTLFRELGNKEGAALALALLGDIRRIQGDITQARAVCTEGVALAREGGSNYSLGWSLISLAKVAAAEGQPEQAVCLFGASEPHLNPNLELDPLERADYERAVERVRAQLGEKAFAAAWADGRRMTPKQALAAQGPVTMPTTTPAGPSPVPHAPKAPTSPDGLTTREVEVLRLVAQGLTDAQVAQQLVISPHTVNSHLKAIYGKIGVSSRHAATRYAIEHHLQERVNS
jgi:predicted ATPase/class 3 adenylate cyclase/DNA-binding CsgD family transcriptional regulator